MDYNETRLIEKDITMDNNEKIVIAATAAIVAGSAIVFAIKARSFRKSWEDASDRIKAITNPIVVTPEDCNPAA